MRESHYSYGPVVLELENGGMVAVQRIIHIRKPLAVGIKLMAKGFLSLFLEVFFFLFGAGSSSYMDRNRLQRNSLFSISSTKSISFAPSYGNS